MPAAADLCTRCGLCCAGVFFTYIVLLPEENCVGEAAGTLPIVTRGGRDRVRGALHGVGRAKNAATTNSVRTPAASFGASCCELSKPGTSRWLGPLEAHRTSRGAGGENRPRADSRWIRRRPRSSDLLDIGELESVVTRYFRDPERVPNVASEALTTTKATSTAALSCCSARLSSDLRLLRPWSAGKGRRRRRSRRGGDGRGLFRGRCDRHRRGGRPGAGRAAAGWAGGGRLRRIDRDGDGRPPARTSGPPARGFGGAGGESGRVGPAAARPRRTGGGGAECESTASRSRHARRRRADRAERDEHPRPTACSVVRVAKSDVNRRPIATNDALGGPAGARKILYVLVGAPAARMATGRTASPPITPPTGGGRGRRRLRRGRRRCR